MLPILLTAREDGLWAEPAAGSERTSLPWLPTHHSGGRRPACLRAPFQTHWLPPTAPKMVPFYRAAKTRQQETLSQTRFHRRRMPATG
jgi:hypothetical protein